MGLYRPDAPLQVLAAVKGHPFARDAFFAQFDTMAGISITAVEHPAAAHFFDPDMLAPYDVLLLYDMPGISFEEGGPTFHEPPVRLKDGWARLLASGKGVVALHHAIAGWPAWGDPYADILGGRFLYLPARVRGVDCADSGYRHDVAYEAVRQNEDHPVLDGLPQRFRITDELYLSEVFEDDVVPLLRADHAFVADNFYSAARAVRDGLMFSNRDWTHPPGSNLIAWTKASGRCPVVYLQCGDGPTAYDNPHLRRLLENALRWVASAQARAWAEHAGRS